MVRVSGCVGCVFASCIRVEVMLGGCRACGWLVLGVSLLRVVSVIVWFQGCDWLV